MNERPVHLIVTDDEVRSPLTVFFRLLLAIPHLIWLSLWGIAAFVAVIVNWFATLFAGQSPQGLHDFLAAYIRYAVHVGAYIFLIANPFPDFTGAPGYPVDVRIAPPQRQNRWTVGFRAIIALPAILIATVLSSSGRWSGGYNFSLGLIGVVALLGWWVSLFRGRMPRGLRDAGAYALAYTAQLDAYLFLLTDRYPNADPLLALDDLPTRPADPIALRADEELARSRVTVFFRLIFAIPHLIWLYLWGIVVLFAAIAMWFATLVRAGAPLGLHNFIAAYVRYATHVYAYILLTADPFPGFTGRAGSYPVDLTIEGPRVQNRWRVGFRLFLAIPALLIAGAYGNLAAAGAFLGWFAVLFTGTMPRGLRNAQLLALRYGAQAYGYLYLLTESYPYSGPTRETVTAPASGGSAPFPSTDIAPPPLLEP